MKKMYNYLKLIPVILLGSSLSASAQLTVLSFTGSPQTYTVPPHVNSINVTVDGADGANSSGGASNGGKGGRIVCDLNVTPGQVLTVLVGSAGSTGGYNGGGTIPLGGLGGDGGGASDIRIGGVALSNRVIIAGGGGGAGYDCAPPPANLNRGGQGGGLTGENGFVNNIVTSSNAFGGDQIGAYGGAFGNGTNAVGNGGGGGGGYIGGLAGANTGPGGSAACGGFGGGGGGSSYADITQVSSSITTVGGSPVTPSGNGSVSICAAGIAGVIIPLDSVCVVSTVSFIDTTGSAGGVWSSSNTGVATVNPVTGAVTGVAPGTTIISRTVTTPCGNATAKSYVTVRAYPAAITGTGTLSLCTNTTITLSDATTGGTWSSPSTLITVGSTSGDVTAGNTGGAATITYSDHGCAVNAPITIIQGPDTVIGPTYVCSSGSVQFSDATPGGTWSTNAAPTQAVIDPSTGVLSSYYSGNITIYYNQGGCRSPKIIGINDAPGSIFGTSSLCAGSSTSLIEFSPGGSWSSSNTKVAGVDQYGDVNAYSGGPDTIFYTIPGCAAAEFDMNIDQAGPILGITSICLTSVIALSDTSAGGTWTSSDPTVAKIDPTLGLLSAGPSALVGSTATITYSIPAGCIATRVVTAASSAPPILGPTAICQGASATLSDTATGGTWSSTDLSIAQIVDTSGVVHGIAAGIVNISYTLASGCYATESFVVQTLLPANPGLTRFPAGDTLCQGTTVRFTVNPLYSGTGPIYTWSLFGVDMGTVDTFYYTPKHGDVITVTMKVGTGVCAASDTVRDSVTYNIDSIKAPTIDISLGSPLTDTIKYLGQEFTFNSSVHYGGENAKYQWYRNGAAIPGATSIYYKAAVYYTDTFFCVVTGNPPCAAPSSVSSNAIIVYNMLYKLNTQTASNVGNSVTLFPNPSKGTLTLNGTLASGANEEVSVEISDMLGQIVYTGSTTTTNGVLHKEIKLDNVAEGSYLMRVNSSTGSDVIHFVVSK